MLRFCSKIIRNILLCAYYCIRPLLGPATCRFTPSCGAFARQQLHSQPLIPALLAIAKHLWRCRPFG